MSTCIIIILCFAASDLLHYYYRNRQSYWPGADKCVVFIVQLEAGLVAVSMMSPAARMSSSVSSPLLKMRLCPAEGREKPIFVIIGLRSGSLYGPTSV